MPKPPFHESLASLRQEILEISFVARATWRAATEAIVQRDVAAEPDIARAVALLRERSVSMEAKTFQLLSANAPMAADLRLVLVTQRVTQELAVIGALALEAAQRVSRLSASELTTRSASEIAAMGAAVDDILRDAIDAFLSLDAVAAAGVIAQCDAVEERHFELTNRLFAEDASPRTTTELVSAARVFPRVADHIGIIAERVAFLATGHLGASPRP